MKLSELNKGDFFKFIDGETALYMSNNNNAIEYTAFENIEFEVLKRNEMSVKVRPINDRIEYVFKFKGHFNNNTKEGVDCNVEIVYSNLKQNG